MQAGFQDGKFRIKVIKTAFMDLQNDINFPGRLMIVVHARDLEETLKDIGTVIEKTQGMLIL